MIIRISPVARLMVGMATLAVVLATLSALRTSADPPDLGSILLLLMLASPLAAAADRAMFGAARRAFWGGFAVTGFLVAAGVIYDLPEVHQKLVANGPPIVRVRQEYVRQVAVYHHMQVRLGRTPAGPAAVARPSEWWMLASLLSEVALGLALGLTVAIPGGLLATLLARAARFADRVRRDRPHFDSRDAPAFRETPPRPDEPSPSATSTAIPRRSTP